MARPLASAPRAAGALLLAALAAAAPARAASPSPAEVRARLVAAGFTPTRAAGAPFARLPRYAKVPGWPIRGPRILRANLNEPRGATMEGYHFGVDLWVDDTRPDAGAPAGRSHRVYALVAGRVRGGSSVGDDGESAGQSTLQCSQRRLYVGAFSYWHVSRTVRIGAVVRAGQPIGWTCRGEWHVHVSERVGSRYVNPLRAGGALLLPLDDRPPEVGELRFEDADGGALDPADLHGQVDLLARVDDPIARVPDVPVMVTDDGRLPYEVRVTVRDASGAVVLRHTPLRDDVQLQPAAQPFWNLFGPETARYHHWLLCLARSYSMTVPCPTPMQLHVFNRGASRLLDTTLLPDGDYTVEVAATDMAGNRASTSVAVHVANAAARTP